MLYAKALSMTSKTQTACHKMADLRAVFLGLSNGDWIYVHWKNMRLYKYIFYKSQRKFIDWKTRLAFNFLSILFVPILFIGLLMPLRLRSPRRRWPRSVSCSWLHGLDLPGMVQWHRLIDPLVWREGAGYSCVTWWRAAFPQMYLFG